MIRRTSLVIVSLTIALASASLADGAVRLLDSKSRGGGRSLALDAALGKSWDAVNVARLVARTPESQKTLPASSADGRLAVELGGGCTLILADLGPASAKGLSDAWRRVSHATKIVTCGGAASPREALAERVAAAGMMTEKTGSRIEIRPLRSPTLVPPGSDLPVRIYFESSPRPGVEVEAVGPGGERRTKTTDAVGATWFSITESGSWTVRYRTVHEGAEYVAELSFEVPSKAFWESVPPLVPRLGTKAGARTADTDEWRELGPAPLSAGGDRNTGRAASIAAPAGLSNRYYLGAASGGVWESINGGRSWRSLNRPLPFLAIGALAVDPGNHRALYAGSGEANIAYHSLYGLGLYRSFNRGRTWRVLAPEVFSGRTFQRLVVSPFDSRVIWAAVGRAGGTFRGFEGGRDHPRAQGRTGIFRSRDRGLTWRHLRARNGLPAAAASDVDLDPVEANRIYATIGDVWGLARNGVYRSTDGGESFTPVLTSLTAGETFGRVTLAIAPSDPDRLYALVTRPASRATTGGFSPGGASVLGLWRSDDGGDTWTRFTPANFMGGQGSYNSTVVVDPEDPDTVFLGGVQMLRSTDAGETYFDVTPVHVDHHETVFDGAGRLLVANDGGVNRSDDLGNTWVALNEGLGLVQFYPGLSLHPTNPDVVLAGTQDNGTNLRLSDSRDWVAVFGGDGGYTAINPDNPDVMFVEFQGTGNLFRSADGGLGFDVSATGIAPGDRNCFLPPFVFDPNDSSRMLYATHRIYESTDGGVTWRAISDDLTSGAPWAVHSLAIAPSNSNVAYALTNDGRVLVSSNGGAVWDLVLEDVAGWPRVTRQIAVDPGRPSQAYVADMGFGGRRLSATLDRGATWREIGDGLPDVPVNTVAVHREGNRRLIFAGTDAGVFLSRNFGRTWREFGTLPKAPVMDLVVDAARDRLVASTLGRGAWSIALP